MIVGAVLVLTATAAAALDASQIRLRDAYTGLAVSGTVTLAPASGDLAPTVPAVEAAIAARDETRVLEVDGGVDIALDQPQALIARAAGYRPLHAVLRPASGHAGWTLLLEPRRPPGRQATAGDDRLLVDGWVRDHETAEPLADVRIAVAGRAASTRSREDGYFALELAPPRVEAGMPEALTITASREGYPRWRREGVLAGAGRTTLRVALGAPAVTAMHRQLMRDGPWPPSEPPGRRLPQRSDPAHRADVPPAAISVGFADAGCSVACCSGDCTTSCVMGLETYVRRGVGDEWIASWDEDALAAGAVAYRSYGAWHAFNPPAHGAYDICSSACCQVNTPATHASTDAAAAATAGLMLIRDGQVFRSEYSAQNNCLPGELSCANVDLSCGDGFAGSPQTGWPCLADPPSAGRDCFGHGRGMSQWGNHYWTLTAPPRHWKWQLDHYYNDNGDGTQLRTATISQVLAIDAARPPERTLAPGETFEIELDARNLAAGAHARVMLGASLRRGSDPFIDDPANDRRVELVSGTSTVARNFELPLDAPSGEYALWLALWIDVDDDGAISGVDLAQELIVLDDAVSVGEGLFADRFEGP